MSYLVFDLASQASLSMMMDRARIIFQEETGETDPLGAPVISTKEVVLGRCSFSDQVSKEKWLALYDVEEVDAEIRFFGVVPAKGCKVVVEERGGHPVHNQEFEVVGIRDRGPGGFVCALKAVKL